MYHVDFRSNNPSLHSQCITSLNYICCARCSSERINSRFCRQQDGEDDHPNKQGYFISGTKEKWNVNLIGSVVFTDIELNHRYWKPFTQETANRMAGRNRAYHKASKSSADDQALMPANASPTAMTSGGDGSAAPNAFYGNVGDVGNFYYQPADATNPHLQAQMFTEAPQHRRRTLQTGRDPIILISRLTTELDQQNHLLENQGQQLSVQVQQLAMQRQQLVIQGEQLAVQAAIMEGAQNERMQLREDVEMLRRQLIGTTGEDYIGLRDGANPGPGVGGNGRTG